jgi:hypothetical protein
MLYCAWFSSAGRSKRPQRTAALATRDSTLDSVVSILNKQVKESYLVSYLVSLWIPEAYKDTHEK